MILGATIWIPSLTGAAVAQQARVNQVPSCTASAAGNRVADGRTSEGVGPDERERLLLERIERLERRLSEIESRLSAKSGTDLAEQLTLANAAVTLPPSGVVRNQPGDPA